MKKILSWVFIAVGGAITAIAGQVVTNMVTRNEVAKHLEEGGSEEESSDEE